MLLVTTLNMVLNKTVTVPGPKNVTVGSGYKIQMIIKNAVPVSVTKEFSLLTLPSRADLTCTYIYFLAILCAFVTKLTEKKLQGSLGRFQIS